MKQMPIITCWIIVFELRVFNYVVSDLNGYLFKLNSMFRKHYISYKLFCKLQI